MGGIKLGYPVYAERVGLATAEVYYEQGVYQVFVVGDCLRSFLGSTPSLDECKAEIVMLLEGGEEAFKARKHRYAY